MKRDLIVQELFLTGQRRYVVDLGFAMGNPRVFEGYPYPCPPKTHTHAQGACFHGYGFRVLRVKRVRKPV
jgi:hypothetical protein